MKYKDIYEQMESAMGKADMNRGWYKLDDNKKVIACTMLESAMEREKRNFIVKQEMIGDIKISTVFLGLDHSMDSFNPPDDHKPIVFETMIFGGEHEDYQMRCSTWDEALLMHQEAVDLVKGNRDESIKDNQNDID